MRKGLAAATALVLGFAPVHSASADVVVELFTSQGCSSCPPADVLLGKLAKRDGVIALSLHVDYWDYLGWKDAFASPAFSDRQRRYASAAGSSMIYTPQMIIDGRDQVVGTKGMEVADLIASHKAAPKQVNMTATRAGAAITVRAEPKAGGPARMIVQLVEYVPSQTVSIKRGENAGRDVTYHNVVTAWTKLADWDGKTALSFEAKAVTDQSAAIIIQEGLGGAIVAAAKVN